MAEEELKAIQNEMAELKEKFSAANAENEKLKKIFDERQTKILKKEDVLKKDELLKVLGIEKDPTKEPIELVNEKIATLGKTVETLTNQLKEKDEKLALSQKQSSAEKIAQKFNFNDIEDALKFIDINSENVENELRTLAETKPYLIKVDNPANIGSTFNTNVLSEEKTLSAFEEGFDKGSFK